MEPRRERALIVAILAGGLLLRLPPIGQPFLSNLDSYGALYATAARNLLRHGFAATRGLPLLNTGPATPDGFEPYVNHPPLVPWLVAGTFALFGEREAAARLLPLAASVAAHFLLLLLTRRLFGPRAALLAALLFAALPMGTLHGTLVDPQGWLPMTALLGMSLSVRRLVEGGRGALAGLFASFLLGALADWPVHLAVPFVALAFAHAGRRRAALALPALSALLLAASLGVLVAARPAGDPADLLYKLGGPEDLRSLLDGRLAASWRALFTLPVLALAALGAALLALARSPALPDVLLLLLPAALYVALSPQGALPHGFWSIYLLPGIALLAGVALDRIAGAALRPGPAAPARAAAVWTVVALVTGHAVLTTLREYRVRTEGADLDARMGRRIAAESSFTDRVATAAAATDALRWYADRRLKGDVRTPAAFRALGDGAWDLFFLPLVQAQAHPDLLAHLRARHPERRAEEFLVYDLRRLLPDARAAGAAPASAGDGPRALRARVLGREVRLEWRPPAGRDALGYRLHCGPEPGVYATALDVGRETSFRTPPLPPGNWVFAVTARGHGGTESALSEEAGVVIGSGGLPWLRLLTSAALVLATLLVFLAGMLWARRKRAPAVTDGA